MNEKLRRPSVKEIQRKAKEVIATIRVGAEILILAASPIIGAKAVTEFLNPQLAEAADCTTKNTVRAEWVHPDNTVIGTATGRGYLFGGSNSNPVILRTNNQGLGIDSATNRAYAELKGESNATLANKPAMNVRVQSLDSGESTETIVPCGGTATFEKKIHPAPGVTVTPGVGPTFATDRGTPLAKTSPAEVTPPVKTPVIPKPDSIPVRLDVSPVPVEDGLGLVDKIDQSIKGIYEIPIFGLHARVVEFVVDLPAKVTDRFFEPDFRPALRWGINGLAWLLLLSPMRFGIGIIRPGYPRTLAVRTVRYPFRFIGARRQYHADVADANVAGTPLPVWHRPNWS